MSAPRAVIEAVCRFYDVAVDDVMSDSRRQQDTHPRHVACYLLHEHTGVSYPKIGELFDRHHTTILQSVRTVQESTALLAEADRILAVIASESATRPGGGDVPADRRRRVIDLLGAAGTPDSEHGMTVRDVFVRAGLELTSVCPDGEMFTAVLHRLAEAEMWAIRAAEHPCREEHHPQD